MSPRHAPVKVVSHVKGRVSVRAGAYEGEIELEGKGEPVRIEIGPGGLDLPARLRAKKPGALVVLEDDPKRPVVMASHGRRADLGTAAKLVQAATAANRPVEIHVFDNPGDTSD